MTTPRPPRERDGWRYRRFIVFALTVLALVLPFVPTVNPDIYWPVYTLITGTVGAYIGFATAEDMGRQRSVPPRRVLSRVDAPDADGFDEDGRQGR